MLALFSCQADLCEVSINGVCGMQEAQQASSTRCPRSMLAQTPTPIPCPTCCCSLPLHAGSVPCPCRPSMATSQAHPRATWATCWCTAALPSPGRATAPCRMGTAPCRMDMGPCRMDIGPCRMDIGPCRKDMGLCRMGASCCRGLRAPSRLPCTPPRAS